MQKMETCKTFPTPQSKLFVYTAVDLRDEFEEVGEDNQQISARASPHCTRSPRVRWAPAGFSRPASPAGCEMQSRCEFAGENARKRRLSGVVSELA